MLFHSIEFLIFLPVLLLLRYLLPKKHEKLILLAASYIFYAWWSVKFLVLLFFSTIVDFIVGERIYNAKSKKEKKAYLAISLIANLGVLFLFKYFVWANSFLANDLFSASTIILPLGISFYTFQSMSYSLDIYFDKLKPSKDISSFALYVSFFPQLVAGPIERARNLIPQFTKGPQALCIRAALSLIVWGLIKKLVFADNVSYYVEEVYSMHEYRSWFELVLASYAFALQIYCDFSGYTDIARGLAKLLGYDLMLNFDIPYLAHNIREFWQKWHISLSTWFRDYLYIPLGGNKDKGYKHYSNLLVTMIIAGLWHGANLTFLAWGLWHGILISAHHYWQKLKKSSATKQVRNPLISFGKKLKSGLKIFLTFNLVTVGWIFFRSETIQKALEIIQRIGSLSPHQNEIAIHWEYAFTLMLVFLIITLIKKYTEIREGISSRPFVNWLAIWLGLALLISFASIQNADFIYFQF